MTESLCDRMKNNYENRARYYLTRRTPVILRLDGKNFHNVTKQCEKPFDIDFQENMVATTLYLCEEIQGAKCAYVQSDEISILLTDFDELTTQAWFDYNLQKIISVSAAMASVRFSELFSTEVVFDCRAFNIPKEEVANYFIWRQKDWIRNSVQMLAQAHFSHKELMHKKQSDMLEMLNSIDVYWDDLNDIWRKGTFIYKQPQISGCLCSHTDLIACRNMIERYLGEGYEITE